MEDFGLWFHTGLAHIADWQAYDHILFLLALCGMYSHRDWKSLLLLVTAFTLGHSLTLALAVLKIFVLDAWVIEMLIPATIVVTCLVNLSRNGQKQTTTKPFHCGMALFFGLIHGMGFSFLLSAMLGRGTDLLWPLFGFNLGLEAGQVLLVGATLLLTLLATSLFRIKERNWRFFLSSAVFGISFLMFLERIPR